MEWTAFKDELPEIGKLILFGNHRMVEICIYHPDHERIKLGQLEYKDITHWCYIDPPPPISGVALKWHLKPGSSAASVCF